MASVKKPVLKRVAKKKDRNHECDFCKRKFIGEKSLLRHACEPKRRHLARDEKTVRMGFAAYRQFYTIAYPHQSKPSYEDFAKSKLYAGFIRFGRYVMNINAINPPAFVEFLTRVEAPLNKWMSPVVYETYIRELNKSETPEAAVERNILLMQQWAMDTDNHWTDFFRKVAPTLGTLWLQSGRISPWVMFTASSANDLINRMTDEQVKLIQTTLDPAFWEAKLSKHTDEVDHIRLILDEAGV
jgi:hypothetical protein